MSEACSLSRKTLEAWIKSRAEQAIALSTELKPQVGFAITTEIAKNNGRMELLIELKEMLICGVFDDKSRTI